MTRWPDNDIWNPRETNNRAPRPALVECEPLRRPRCSRRAVFMRRVVKTVLLGGFFFVMILGMFWMAK